MILYEKHLVLMSIALLLLPILGRIYAQQAVKRSRIKRPGLNLAFLLLHLAVALVVPAGAQALFEATGSRWFALALAGAIYGFCFGDGQDYPKLSATFWGALGGLCAAFFFGFFDPSSEARALCVSVFAVAPLLAYRPLSSMVRGRVGSAGVIVPNRQVLR